ncbi:MAG: hypothetical protein HRU14_17825 [Planctomycetes bacterium]|nr:hypothetical protein [Planctomycetota bacterium]
MRTLKRAMLNCGLTDLRLVAPRLLTLFGCHLAPGARTGEEEGQGGGQVRCDGRALGDGAQQAAGARELALFVFIFVILVALAGDVDERQLEEVNGPLARAPDRDERATLAHELLDGDGALGVEAEGVARRDRAWGASLVELAP